MSRDLRNKAGKLKKLVVDNGYRPTEKQKQFHAAPHRYKLFGGAMGGGKSRTLCEEALTLCLEYPGNVGYLCRRDLVDLKLTTLQTLLHETIPPELIKSHNKHEKIIELINGSRILYGDTKDIESLKSLNLGFFVIDEASEVSSAVFHMLDTRLRLKLPGIKYYALLATNPAPGWIKRYFVDGMLENSIFVKSLPSDNPYLPDGYVENLKKTLPENWVKRYIEGDWSAFEGQIFSEFSREVHVIDPVPLEKVVYYGAFDYGIASPSCILKIAVDEQGRYFVVDEIYRPNMTVEEIAQRMHSMGYGEWQALYADPSIFSKRSERNGIIVSVAQELYTYGIYPVAAPNDIIAGISIISQALKPSPHFQFPDGREGEAPRLYIFSNCRNLISEMESYKWASEGTSFQDRPDPRQPDHAVDALRYFMSSSPSKFEPLEPRLVFASEAEKRLHEKLKMLEDGKNPFFIDEHLGFYY